MRIEKALDKTTIVIEPFTIDIEPATSYGMNAQEIMQAIWDEPKTTDKMGRMYGELYDYAQAVSVAIFDPKRWKNPVIVMHPVNIRKEWVIATIEWFHGSTPEVWDFSDNAPIIKSIGYAC
jgi:hypothetical protein